MLGTRGRQLIACRVVGDGEPGGGVGNKTGAGHMVDSAPVGCSRPAAYQTPGQRWREFTPLPLGELHPDDRCAFCDALRSDVAMYETLLYMTRARGLVCEDPLGCLVRKGALREGPGGMVAGESPARLTGAAHETPSGFPLSAATGDET